MEFYVTEWKDAAKEKMQQGKEKGQDIASSVSQSAHGKFKQLHYLRPVKSDVIAIVRRYEGGR